MNGISDRVRTNSKAFSLVQAIVEQVNANQHRNPSDAVVACFMLAMIYAQELDLDLRHELHKAERALTSAEPDYKRDIDGVRHFIRTHLSGYRG
jgi:hypothetical protein